MDGSNIQDSSCENKHFQVSCNEKNHGFRKMYFAALAALSFATAMGMACGYSASATADMGLKNSRVHPSKEEIAWIGSILALGALTGGLFAESSQGKIKFEFDTDYYQPVYTCPYCSEQFSIVKHLKEHMNKQHVNVDNSFKCHFCGLTFRFKYRFLLHQHACHGHLLV